MWIQRPRFAVGREQFDCKPTVKCILSKLVKNRKLNYVHSRKSLTVASPKEHVLVTDKMNVRTKFYNSRMRNGSAVVDRSLQVS